MLEVSVYKTFLRRGVGLLKGAASRLGMRNTTLNVFDIFKLSAILDFVSLFNF